MRLLRRGDCDIPALLCLCAHPSWFAAAGSLNLTAHPTAAWTLQQLREVSGVERGYRYLIRDRDSIFVRNLNESIKGLGLRILKSLPQSPAANAVCERLIGTVRRECLDWLIPILEAHLRSILKIWASHYNRSPPPHDAGTRRARPATEICRAPDSAISTSDRRGSVVDRQSPLEMGFAKLDGGGSWTSTFSRCGSRSRSTAATTGRRPSARVT